MYDNNYNKQKALAKVAAICAKEEKCCDDIRQKLFQWKIEQSDIQDIIDNLINEGYINEQRYCGQYARDKFKFNRWGKIKIAYNLRAKQINEKIISEALESIPMVDYEEMVKDELVKKLKTLNQFDDFTKKGKLFQFGQSRGYETDIIQKLISKLTSSKD